MMLGLGDASILAAILGCLGVTLLCVIYGVLHWNCGAGSDDGKDGRP